MNKNAWLEERKKGLGGTDVAALAGVSPFKSPLGIWADKLGLHGPTEQTLAMTIGLELEPVIARLYERSQNVTVREADFLIHPQEPYFVGSPDRLIAGQEKGLEIKTTRYGGQWGEEGTDQVPLAYLVQCAWYQMLTGYEDWDIAVLIAGSDLRVYHLRRDRDLEEMLVDRARRFWHDHILTQVPPALDGSEDSRRWLARKYPEHSQDLTEATPEATTLAAELFTFRQQQKGLEESIGTRESQLKDLIASSAGLRFPDGSRVTWKRTKDGTSVDWEALANHLLSRLLPAEAAERLSAHTSPKLGQRRFDVRGIKETIVTLVSKGDLPHE